MQKEIQDIAEKTAALLRETIKMVAEAENVSVCYNADSAIEINGQRLVADATKAYVEFFLAHALPVVTVDGTAIHPRVVQNSHRTMLHQVVNFNHMMKSYDPEQFPKDRVLGSVVGVEFPLEPIGGWKVQGDKALAPCMRCVAVVHKAADGVDKILGQHQSGRRKWTVSMENGYFIEDSGFIVRGGGTTAGTPADLAELGWDYVSWGAAPAELRALYDTKESKVLGRLKGADVVFLIGGLDGFIHFNGVGLTPLGKEREAEIGQILASDAKSDPVEVLARGLELLRALRK